jgi:CRISPR-associated protein Cmr4
MPDHRMYWMHALTPVHVGTGSQVGFIDLPIARERTTDWPLIPGSGIKGVLADRHGASDPEKPRTDSVLVAAFGRADDLGDQEANSGALVFTDARLVCLPIRSIFGTFAWATCPLALNRLVRDLEAVEIKRPAPTPAPSEDGESILIAEKSKLTNASSRAFLADLDFKASVQPEVTQWANALAGWLFPGDKDWQAAFRERFAVLADNTFNYFSGTGTEITTRVRIDPATKTVAEGALWTEEALPAESILSGIVWCDRIFSKNNGGLTSAKLIELFATKPERLLQVGGKATVGRGRVRVTFTGKG